MILHQVVLLYYTKFFQCCFQRNILAASEQTYCEYINNTTLVQRSHRLELQATTKAVRKTVRAYRSKKFDKLLVIADLANDIDFMQDVNFYIICLIYVIYFVTLCTLYSTLFSLFSG